MQIEPRTFTLPNGEVLTVRSLCAADAEALNAFRYATYSEWALLPEKRWQGSLVLHRCGRTSCIAIVP